MADPIQTDLLGLSLDELGEVVRALEEPGYRARQIFAAIYGQRVSALADITTLPQSLRRRLQEAGHAVGRPLLQQRYTSTDGTIRYLMAFADGQSVETVWMPEGDFGESGDGSEAADELARPPVIISPLISIEGVPQLPEPGALRIRGRATICISSQAGCAVDCTFCMTALLGLQRNLSAGEIVGQVLNVLSDRGVDPPRDRINLVFMGQGEPFLNYPNFIKAVRLLVEGAGIPESRMTVSTAGIVPRIADLGRETIRPKLAISLNAPNDEIRARIMPINRKWNIEQLLDAARQFPLRPRERLTFEYVLLGQVNDEPAHARELAGRLRGLRAKVNLIALNPGPGIAFATPQEERVFVFQKILLDAGIDAFLRRPRGRDIYAACGQLKRMAG